MTVDAAAALQELHGRLAEIEEMVNGSTEREVSGAMTKTRLMLVGRPI